MLTIVPTSGTFEPDKLSIDACLEARDEVLAKLMRCGVPPALGCFEVAFNEDETGEVAPHWCAHSHHHVLDWPDNDCDWRLREAFPATAMTKRPVKWVALDGRPNAFAYLFKPDRDRRVTYLEASNPN